MKKIYIIIYIILITILFIGFILIKNNDMLKMVLAAIAIILTSVFTYSNRSSNRK